MVWYKNVAEEGYNEYNKSDMETDSDPEFFTEEEAQLSLELQKFLPAHLRCAHILSLYVTSDAARILTTSKDLSIMQPNYKKM